MKLELDKNILESIKCASKILGKEDKIWLLVEDGILTIESNNGSIEYTDTFPIKSKEKGILGFPGILFSKMVKDIKDVIISFNEKKANNLSYILGNAEIKYENGKAKMSVINSNQYMGNEIEECIHWIKSDFLKVGIQDVIFSVAESSEEVGVESLLNVYIHKIEKKVRIIGLNGHLFAMREFECEDDKFPSETLFFKFYAQYILKFLNDDKSCEIAITDKRIYLKKANGAILSIPKVIGVTYPDYTYFMKQLKDAQKIVFLKKDLKNAIDRSIIINETIDVSFIFENGYCIFSSESQKGTSNEKIKYDGNLDLNIRFNIEVLQKVLNHIRSDYINFYFTTNVGPCEITGDSELDKDYTIIFMPVIDEERTTQ